MDNGSYPTTAQGLGSLTAAPTTAPQPKNWQGPYLKGQIPNDPWGKPYNYRAPGVKNPSGYDLSSSGPDGAEGTEDDINNWSTGT